MPAGASSKLDDVLICRAQPCMRAMIERRMHMSVDKRFVLRASYHLDTDKLAAASLLVCCKNFQNLKRKFFPLES